MDVGLVGGTGPAGRGLALRLAATGLRVSIGSRDAARAAGVVEEWLQEWPDRDLDLTGVANGEAAEADIVVMAAPWEAMLRLAPSLADAVADKLVISMANALTRVGGAFLPLTLPRGSVTAELQAALPRSRVVGAFHHLPAGPMGDLERELDCTVLVSGEDYDARTVAMEMIDRVEGLHAIDAGPLDGAGAIEALTAVLVQVNVNYGTHSTLRLMGKFDARR